MSISPQERLAQAERETQELMAQLLSAGPLTPEMAMVLQSAPEAARQSVEDKFSKWKGNRPPLGFFAFIQRVWKRDLYPRQRKVFEDAHLLTPEDLLNGLERCVRVMVIVWGKGAGKDRVCALLLCWAFYVLSCLKEDPATVLRRDYGASVGEWSRISCINIATTQEQAQDVFFAMVKEILGDSLFDELRGDTNWKDPAKPAPVDKIVYYRNKPNGAIYECVGLFSMHSRAASLEGHNVFVWLMDEADAFQDGAEKSNAQLVYQTFYTSASTRFKNWIGMVISFPRVENGFLLRLRDTALENIALFGQKSMYFTDLARTADVNPNFDPNAPDVVEMYRSDPRAAAALYDCIPMAALSAFFEFPEKIAAAVDDSREPIAYVMTENHEIERRHGGVDYYVKATISGVRREPGHNHVMTIDAGRSGDAYVLSVWHWDAQPDAFEWLCPTCGRDPSVRQYAQYKEMEHGHKVPWSTNLHCGSCFLAPTDYQGSSAAGVMVMTQWWHRVDRAESLVMDSSGKPFSVPHLYEDLIVRIKPKRATGPNTMTEEGRNRPVFYPSMYEVAHQLMVKLNVVAVRCDPWQTNELVDRLREGVGGNIDVMSMSQPEQYKRARWAKSMLYAGMLTFLPCPERDKEWRRIQLLGGTKIDHPSGAGEGKDIFDTETGCIWEASVTNCARLSLDFI